MEMDARIKSAEDMLYELMSDPEVRERYWQRRMAGHERATWQAEMENSRKEIEEARKALEEAREEIVEAGKHAKKQEGQKVKEIALNMLQANMDIALIEEFTGLSTPQIEELREKL
jgi:hypothetical protein